MQSIWGWNSSWRKLREETRNLQVEATEREAILHSRRIRTPFPALKKKKQMHRTRTIHNHWISNKSHSRDILTWCALLCPVPCSSPSPQGRACSGNYNRRISKEIWLLFEFLAWFSREKGFSCPSPHLCPPESAAHAASTEQQHGEDADVNQRHLKTGGKKGTETHGQWGFTAQAALGSPWCHGRSREAAAGAPWRRSGAGAGSVHPPGSACTGHTGAVPPARAALFPPDSSDRNRGIEIKSRS